MDEKLSRRLDAFGRALRRAAESLRDDNEEQMSKAVFKLSDRADQYFATIRDKDPRDLFSKAEQFVRSRPVLAFSLMAVVGTIASVALSRSSSYSTAPEWSADLREEDRRVG